MSNIFDTGGISIVPINRNLKVEDIVSRFFDFLQKRKTPADIYDGIQLHSLKPVYAAEYVAVGSFSFDWNAQLTFVDESTSRTKMDPGSGTAFLNSVAIQERMGFFYSMYHDGTDAYDTETTSTHRQLDRGASQGEVSTALPANVNELSGISDKFFLSDDEIFELSNINALLKEPELGMDAVYECEANTQDVETVGIYDLLEQEMNNYAQQEANSSYDGIEHSVNNVHVYPRSAEVYAILIPVWKIDYSYGGYMYTAFVKAHIHGRTGMFGGQELCSGYAPADENKTKGIVNKVKASKEKKNYKAVSRNQAEQYWVNDIKKRFL